MTQTLTDKYRPQTFDDVVGQRLIAVVLQQMVKKGAVPNAILFSGTRGVGKTSLARILAMALNPDERERILDGTSLAVLEIDAASHGSVADIRELTAQLHFSVGVKNHVIILDEAHSITREGFNAMLKTLEEPPADVTFILVTTEPHKLPETILSRLMEFEFRRVTPEDILAKLGKIVDEESFEITRELLAKLAEDADGSVRDAIKNLDFMVRAGVDSVEKYIELTGQKDVGPYLLAALSTGDHAKIFSTLDLLMLEVGDARVIADALNSTITDIFILKSGGEVTASGRALEHRIKLGTLLGSDQLFSAVQVLWELKTRIRQSEDQLGALSMALVLVADKLSDGKPPATVIPDTNVSSEVASDSEAPQPLSLSEMMQT